MTREHLPVEKAQLETVALLVTLNVPQQTRPHLV
jgi:hypothetical protein